MAALPIMYLYTESNVALELLEQAYQLRKSHCKLLNNPKYRHSWPLFTPQVQLTIVKYVMDVVQPFQYGTLWMLKWYIVTLHHVITVDNYMFNHMDGVMHALALKQSQ